jgi:hypothetical protein
MPKVWKGGLNVEKGLLRWWRRSQIHTVGVRVSKLANSVARGSTTASCCCVTTKYVCCAWMFLVRLLALHLHDGDQGGCSGSLPRYDAGDDLGAYNAHMRFAITT